MIDLPWRAIGMVVLAGAVAGLFWWVGGRIRVSYQAETERDAAIVNLTNYKQSVEAQARVVKAQRIKDEKADAALTARANTLADENEKLHLVIARLTSTVERIDAHGNRTVAIAGPWWVCHTAKLSRDPADLAACQARASDGRMPNPVGDGRLQVSP